MRFRQTKDDRVLVVGIFQSSKTGRAVLKNLHRTQFRRAAAIHASARGRPRIEEHGISAIGGSATGSVLSLALGAFIFWERGMLADYRPAGLTVLLAAFALAGALTGWILVRLLQEDVAAASLARCASTILPGETVVLAEVNATETSRLLAILRDVETEAPVTFAFHSPPHFRFKSSARPLGHELPSGQRLAENAARLAHEIRVSREAKPRGPSFLRRLREILPQKQYGKLPLIASGPEAGLPRVYHVASEIVAESGGALEPELIGKFLVAFQATSPLDIGELGALPLMLRLQLLECLRALAIQVELQQSQSEEADFWANRLITAGRHSSTRLLKMMEELVERYPEPTPHFASELVAHLYDE